TRWTRDWSSDVCSSDLPSESSWSTRQRGFNRAYLQAGITWSFKFETEIDILVPKVANAIKRKYTDRWDKADTVEYYFQSGHLLQIGRASCREKETIKEE